MVNNELEEIKQELAQVSKAAAEFNDYKKTKGIRKRNIIIIILTILLILSNVAWFVYESGLETVAETTETVTTTFEDIEQNADNGGSNNIVGGDWINGEAKD